MVNCKRKDCQYADVMGGNRKTGTGSHGNDGEAYCERVRLNQ